MLIRIAAVGQKMPRWINTGFLEYQRRMPAHLKLELTEIALPRRSRNSDTRQLLCSEAEALQASLPRNCLRIAMDAGGRQWTTRALSRQLEDWQGQGRDVGIMIGGPDGFAPGFTDSADVCWSLGLLTLPHPLVRVILAEQLYRAWTITTGHPYHRD